MRFDGNAYGWLFFFSRPASDFRPVLTAPPDRPVKTRGKERLKAILAVSRGALMLEGLPEKRRQAGYAGRTHRHCSSSQASSPTMKVLARTAAETKLWRLAKGVGGRSAVEAATTSAGEKRGRRCKKKSEGAAAGRDRHGEARRPRRLQEGQSRPRDDPFGNAGNADLHALFLPNDNRPEPPFALRSRMV